MSDFLRVGDAVFCKGGFGLDPQRLTRVTAIEVMPHAEANEGAAVPELPWSEVTAAVRVELEDGPWAYGTQLTRPELVIGQCPACMGINRHEPNCTRRGGASQAERAYAEWKRCDDEHRRAMAEFDAWRRDNPLDSHEATMAERAFLVGWHARGRADS